MTTELMLRTCNMDMTSFGGFTWPREGLVEAPDWDPAPECGGGLHGLLWGEGEGNLLSWETDAVWLVCEVNSNDVVELRGKIKVPKCNVVHCGDQQSATNYLLANGGAGKTIVGATATAGNHGTATATAGYRGTATAGDHGTATAGDYGTARADYSGTAIAGCFGTAVAGNYGIAKAGVRGLATAGDCGTATAGKIGIISIWRYERKAVKRLRLIVGYVGEGGLLPDTPYKLDDEGNFVEVKEIE